MNRVCFQANFAYCGVDQTMLTATVAHHLKFLGVQVLILRYLWSNVQRMQLIGVMNDSFLGDVLPLRRLVASDLF